MTRILFKTAVIAALFCGPAKADPAAYGSPQEALEAMVAALKSPEEGAVLAVFGSEAADYLSDGDPIEDKINKLALLSLYREGYRLVPQDDGSVLIALGEEGWLFPVPIAKTDTSWSFDNDAGREEVRLREIGRNELDVIELMEAYVEVQADFRAQDQDGDGVREFASQIISTSADQRDGLFWADEGTLLGELFARASAFGYSDGENDHPPEPYSGYYFRILTEQTDAAPGGAMDYFVNGHMVAGHALLAVPAEFGETGVHSFMVSENGIVYEAVLGEDTLEKAAAMTSFDPSEDWHPVN
ncbi:MULTISPECIES: DUF2950 family protein [unclassified Ruegeria]|uniref:DUF2950 family protein n=1 Tax=unclassified Ruegeria TaxID=2625375 RepID=UPI0014899CDF|nr:MULTISPECIES: DUF2950 family protein [unclassified Ruegeria]